MFTSFSFWSLIFNVLILIVSVSGFIKIMKNDLTHIQTDVTEMKEDLKHLYDKVNGLCQRVSNIEGKLSK